ncbi:MAG TPA: pyridoxal-phosphate dependent enzyme [Anaerolineales bacterium]|nr:pyridoxal-phosphate dependent enzyme [Anaerolineales bacterium]
MTKSIHVVCRDCSHQTDFTLTGTTCPNCGSEWREARYDYREIAGRFLEAVAGRDFNLWRYEELLPIRTPMADLTLGSGGTPLLRAANLGMMLGNQHIYIKDERQGPTGSFKDRQAALTIAALKEAGVTELVVASTGNVAIAYSALAARSGIKCWAFLNSQVPAEKMREVALYGTQVIKVTGTYDQAKQVAAEFAAQRGFYLDRGTRSIPSVEAMKTIAFEAAEQLARVLGPRTENGSSDPPLRAPDWYVQAVSGGLGPVGVIKGFDELLAMGLIDRVPKIAILQTEGCSPMVRAWKQGSRTAEPVPSPNSIISTLATGDPGRAYTLIYDAMERGSGGVFESVTDEEAFRALHVTAKMEGLSTELATGVGFAGLIKLVRAGVIRPDEVVLVNCTGHTMPVEPAVLGANWAHSVEFTARPDAGLREEGLLSALRGVTQDRFPHILVADDTPEARRLIVRILQSQGNFTISEAENGRVALEIARKDPPDLVILDLMMPEMDGFTVLDRFKDIPSLAEVPVIVVTAKELTVREKARLAGRIKSLMQKGSFMDDDLFEEIRQLVE